MDGQRMEGGAPPGALVADADQVASGIATGADVFEALVKPRLLEVMGGKIIDVESRGDPLSHSLDTLAGIDLLHVDPRCGVRGIARRVQYTDRCHRSFTVRKSRDTGQATEYDKRLFALEHGYLYPEFTLQCYVTRDKRTLLGFGIAQTAAILRAIQSGFCRERHTKPDEVGQATFYVVDWAALWRIGAWLYTYESPGL